MASTTYTGAAPPSRPEHRERELSNARRAELADDFARRMSSRGEALARAGERERAVGKAASGAASRTPGAERAIERQRSVDSPSAGRPVPVSFDEIAPGGPLFDGRFDETFDAVRDGSHEGVGDESFSDFFGGATSEETTSRELGDAPSGFEESMPEEEHVLCEALDRKDALERAERAEEERGREDAADVVAAGGVEATVPNVRSSSSPDDTDPDLGGTAAGTERRLGELAERLVERLDELELADAATCEEDVDAVGSWQLTLEHDADELGFIVTRRSSGGFVVTLDATGDDAFAELERRLAGIDPRIVLEPEEGGR